MLSTFEIRLIKRIFPLVITLAIFFLVFLPGPLDWRNTFFLSHDYPFDYYSWRSVYINEGNGRISSLGLISLFPNVLLSQALHGSWEFLQSFVVKIAPLFIFIYFFSKKLVSKYFFELKDTSKILFLAAILFLLQFNLAGQMAMNTGVFYNLMFQMHFYLFLWSFSAYLLEPDSIYTQRSIYLSALLLQTSVIIGSTFIPTCIYLCALYFTGLTRIIGKRNFWVLFGVFLSSLLYLFLVNLQNISVETGIDEAQNFVVNRGYENIAGGYFYQFIGYTNWGIYTGWKDRLFGGFTSYYLSGGYQIALLMLNGLSLFYIVKTKRIIILVILCIFIILSAASQSPFGKLFVWLIDSVPGFQSIRTPDNKFGIYTQAILLLCLLDSWPWYKRAARAVMLISLALVIVINIAPIIKGDVIYGSKSQFAPTSTYVVDVGYEKKLLDKIDPNDFVLIAPGMGNFDHPSGRIGYIDPIFHLHKDVISYHAVLSEKRSKYYPAIYQDMISALPNVNVLIIRKSEKFSQAKSFENAGFKKVYEDRFSEIYKSDPKPINLSFENKYLIYIVAVGIFLYGFWFWLLFSLIYEKKSLPATDNLSSL